LIRLTILPPRALASRTALTTLSTEGWKKNRNFLATVLPSTWTVNSPRLPFTSTAWTDA
jgi:hypothetical protein